MTICRPNAPRSQLNYASEKVIRPRRDGVARIRVSAWIRPPPAVRLGAKALAGIGAALTTQSALKANSTDFNGLNY
jgi:hypothetical protein